MFHGGECFLCVQPPTSTVLWENWGSWQPMEDKGRHPGSLCTSGWQGRQLHATGLETRPGEGQVTGASSPAALPSVLDLSPLCPQDPSALARVLSGSGFGWQAVERMRKLANGRAAYNSHLLLPEREHKYKFLSQKIMAKDTFLWRKTMTNLNSVLKSRDITLLWFFRCDSWTLKKAEYQRTEAFKLWSWRRLLRIPWAARRSNQWILKETNLEYSMEGLMLRLKLQYFGYLNTC